MIALLEKSATGAESTSAGPAPLPEPKVTGCGFDDVLLPPLAAMTLDWHEPRHGPAPHVWELPSGIKFFGPAPVRFGILIHREDSDSYLVRLVWNEMQFGWKNVTRRQLLDCSLSLLLAAIGTSLDYLLDQPISHADHENRS